MIGLYYCRVGLPNVGALAAAVACKAARCARPAAATATGGAHAEAEVEPAAAAVQE